MERLTQRDEYGNADIIAISDMMPELYAELSFSETNALTDALNRLAAYEDSEMTPAEIQAFIELWKKAAERVGFIKEHDIDHLQELVQAEAEGRLVTLPCKVGDTVWFKTYEHNGSVCVGVRPYKVLRFKTAAIVHSDYDDIDLPMRDFGKTVFRTREEAEAALQKEADR